ncbi:MAG: Uma2 family endonuclease [Deltaproteobacteria bacterium]|nr:Uma2 family endonuclease [Deltaproteobacteria bacterium]
MPQPPSQTETPQHLTWSDYQHWSGPQRWELIDGQARAMSPAPGVLHQDVVLEIASQAKQFLEDKPGRAFVAPLDVRLPQHDEADEQVDTVVQPDVLVVCDPSKLDERGVRGAPDWVVEVISPGTAGYDQVRKRRVYERAGVREFWLVHPQDRLAILYRHDGKAFGRPDVLELEGSSEVAVLPGLVIDWSRVARWLPPLPVVEDMGPVERM